MKEELRYTVNGLSVEALNDAVDDLWTEIQDPSSDLSQRAAKQGVDIEKLRAMKREDVIQIDKEGETFDPLITTIIVAFLPVAVGITKDLWQKVILPKITQEKGGVLEPGQPGNSEQ